MTNLRSFSLLLALILMLGVSVYAGEVDVKDAATVARSFYYEQVASTRGIAHQTLLIEQHFAVPSEEQADYHVFNFHGGGWVIVSAEDIVKPILAYGKEGSYTPGKGSPSHIAWMEEVRKEMAWYRTNIQAEAAVQELWSRYMTGDPSTLGRPEGVQNIQPLMKSKWGQGKYYNTMCPADPNGEDGHALVGCVATSMSQVMYYYRHPAHGAGSFGYTANNAGQGYGNYGYLFVNFANATYGWDGMNNSLSGNNANLSVAELCYHAGVSVSMAFGPDKSGSQTTYTVPALKNYFGYSSSVSYLQRMQYTATNWQNIIKSNLDTKKPLIYGGHQPSPGGGHAWNLDGYEETSNGFMVHCNWGWDGMHDGFYLITNMAPGSEPAFSNNQGMVVNIYPAGSYPQGCSSATKDVKFRAGAIEDGSGPIANYQDNMDCYWLIHPEDSVGKIILNFSQFDVADDGDVLTVYDGGSTSDPVLATFNLTNQPYQVTSSSSKLLLRFTTNGGGNAAGWQAFYTTTNPGFCSNNIPVTAASGTISDGSGPAKYSNNSTCSWLINPPFGKNLTISFTSFDVAAGDYINVYDWGTQALLLNKYSGNTPPPNIVAPSGAAYIEFKTDWAINGQGWEATYTVGNVGMDEQAWNNSLRVYPVPAEDYLTIEMALDRPETLEVHLMDITGRVVSTNRINGTTGIYTHQMDVQGITSGLYLLKVEGQNGSLSRKVMIK